MITLGTAHKSGWSRAVIYFPCHGDNFWYCTWTNVQNVACINCHRRRRHDFKMPPIATNERYGIVPDHTQCGNCGQTKQARVFIKPVNDKLDAQTAGNVIETLGFDMWHHAGVGWKSVKPGQPRNLSDKGHSKVADLAREDCEWAYILRTTARKAQ